MNIKLTEEQMFDYINCPAMFEMKYIKKIPYAKENKFKELLDKASKYFYINLLQEKICTAHEMKKAWDKICLENKNIIDPKKAIEGMGLINKFLLWAQDQQIVIIDVGTSFSVVVDNVEVTGILGVVSSNAFTKNELLITDFSNRMIEQEILDMKLKYSLDAYAFKKVYNKFIDNIRYQSVKYNKELYSLRSDMDFKRLEVTIKSVGQSIINKSFYPREGIACQTCPMKIYCKQWHY